MKSILDPSFPLHEKVWKLIYENLCSSPPASCANNSTNRRRLARRRNKKGSSLILGRPRCEGIA